MKELSFSLLLGIFFLASSSPMEGGLSQRVNEFLKGCKLAKAVSYKNLTLLPIVSAESKKLPKILTLDEASKGDKLVISEVGEGDVNRVSIQNNSNAYVFIMAGEILTGCKQDRVLKYDTLIPPKSEKFIVPVYCVEAGRWHWSSPRFAPAPAMASVSVRRKAEVAKSQTEVWGEISYMMSELSARVPGEALKGVYDVPFVKDEMEDYFKALREIPRDYPDAKGVAVAIGDEILCVDIFCERSLFENLYPKLLKSYILEALAKKKSRGKTTMDKVMDFLESLSKADVVIGEKPPAGDLLEMETPQVKGSALVFHQQVIHLSAFPKKEGIQEVPPIFRRYR
ncbi:MAG: ARPP-1 family domain-containing protein [bacterium]